MHIRTIEEKRKAVSLAKKLGPTAKGSPTRLGVGWDALVRHLSPPLLPSPLENHELDLGRSKRVVRPKPEIAGFDRSGPLTVWRCC